MAQEISLEELKKEVAGLEFHIENLSDSLENALVMIDRVKAMVRLIETQVAREEEKSGK